MNRNMAKLMLLAGIGALGGLLPHAAADDWNQKTVITFNSPVEIPGQVLEAGTYVFKVLDSPSDRNVVQVFSKDERHLLGTYITIPDERQEPAGDTILIFDERVAGAPEAIKSWFYPGKNYGHDFIYPKRKPLVAAVAQTIEEPAKAEVDATPVVALDTSQVESIQPPSVEVQVPAEDAIVIEELVVRSQIDVEDPELPAELPQTASAQPTVGFLGLISLAVAGTILFFARRN